MPLVESSKKLLIVQAPRTRKKKNVRLHDRLCLVDGCPTELSSDADEERLPIPICGHHQVQLNKLKEKYPDFDELPEKDRKFVIRKLIKGCNAKELALQLGKWPGLIYSHIRQGNIKTSKDNKIPISEIVRLLILERLYITVRQIFKDSGYNKNTLLFYARQGWLGPTAYGCKSGNSKEALMIQEALLPYLPRLYTLIKQKRCLKPQDTEKYRTKNERTIAELQELLKLSYRLIYSWIRSGELKARLAKNWFYVVKIEDLRDFVERIRNNVVQISMREKTRQKLLALDFSQPPFTTK